MDDPADLWVPEPKYSSVLSVLYHKWLPPFALLLLITWLVLLWRYGWYPPVGTYIAIVAIGAVVVTIWPPENRWTKAAWLGIFLFLGVFEIHNLYRDRAEHDKAERAARKLEEQAFQSIANGITASIEENQRHFDATMSTFGKVIGKEERIATITSENLARMTGGDSYIYFEPGDIWSLSKGLEYDAVLTFVGKYPLNDVTVRIAGHHGMEFRYDYGTVGPADTGKLRFMPVLTPPANGDSDLFAISINFDNGAVSEVIKIHKVNGRWLRAVRVVRIVKLGHPVREVLKTYVEPGFPTNRNGEVDWDAW